MKITKNQLESLIKEAMNSVTSLKENNTWGIDWNKMAYLGSMGDKLSPKWQLIMAARNLSDEDMDKALAILKSAVATLELHKNRSPKEAPVNSGEDTSMDFGLMNTGISSKKP